MAPRVYRVSYIIANALLNLLNELRKRDKVRGLPSTLSRFATSLINSIIQDHECYHMTLKYLKIAFLV